MQETLALAHRTIVTTIAAGSSVIENGTDPVWPLSAKSTFHGPYRGNETTAASSEFPGVSPVSHFHRLPGRASTLPAATMASVNVRPTRDSNACPAIIRFTSDERYVCASAGVQEPNRFGRSGQKRSCRMGLPKICLYSRPNLSKVKLKVSNQHFMNKESDAVSSQQDPRPSFLLSTCFHSKKI